MLIDLCANGSKATLSDHLGDRAAVKTYLIATILCLSAVPALGSPIFVPTFTAAFNSNFGGNAATAQAAWVAAANNLASSFSDNIHINITVDAVAGTSIFGMSNTPLIMITYGNLYNAALQDAKSADDAASIGLGGSLGGTGTLGSASDPIGGPHNWWVTRAQGKALGLSPDDSTSDGTTTFGAGFAYTFFGAIQPGTYDFQGLVTHEISEIMGRLGLCGTSIASVPGYTLLDAFSFSGLSVRNTGNGTNANFSIDSGSTLLKGFNAQTVNGGDCRDWASGTNDAFNAFAATGVPNSVTGVDLRVADVIGYDLIVIAKRRRGQITSQ
jgi:hypothetical protein